MKSLEKLNYINKRIKELDEIARFDKGVRKEVILATKARLMKLEFRVKELEIENKENYGSN